MNRKGVTQFVNPSPATDATAAAVATTTTTSGVKRERDDDDAVLRTLRTTFGMHDLREGQRTIIDAILGGFNALAIFPTGGGKSLCYQLPALLFPGDALTLVVSPLIALMKDQVDSLKAKNVAADMITSALTAEENREVRSRVQSGKTRILYVAPEQLNNEGTCMLLQSRHIALLAIDEAHCISEWGHSFRPDYLRLPKFAKACRAARVLCLTATAPLKVSADICSAFAIQPAHCVRTSFHRPNLHMGFEFVASDADRDRQLQALLRHNDQYHGATIIYATRQETTESVAKLLTQAGFSARAYHAGMDPEARTAVQEWFMQGGKDVIVVATIAFGMGIDKSDIRRVIHYQIAKSLEGYAQEIGRAGRDGLPSQCTLFFHPDDLFVLKLFACCGTPSVRNLLRALQGFFFGERSAAALRVGMVLEVSIGGLARKNDLTETAVNMLLAYMGIYHGLVETTTPKYIKYSLQGLNGAPLASVRTAVEAIQPPAVAQVFLKNFSVKMTWCYIDLETETFPTATGVTRDQVITAIDLQLKPKVKVVGSGVRHCFTVTKVPPASLAGIATEEYARFRNHETRELARLEEVVSFVVGTTCHSRVLMGYFGETPPPAWQCDSCPWCRPRAAGTPPPSVPSSATTTRTAVSTGVPAAGWQKLEAAVQRGELPRDDPRLLAYVAIGGRSPRITSLKLAKHPDYACLKEARCSFEEILRKCEDLCGRKDSDV